MRDSYAGTVFRVEVIREEARGPGAVSIDITAYIDREPDDNEADFGVLSRVPPSIWNTRMLLTGDFASLGEAVAAIERAYPNAEMLNCYEWPPQFESAVTVAPLLRSGRAWRRGGCPADASTAQLDWRP
ncbi:MAG: hypothetical protein JO032_21360 [Alphaproteobacteria bacterium]|nr:hypothetical protein [Alphaproteobacteria bacterium]MBV9555337.1 hypothetical protein [Alphaproteobacteria bacterium]